MSTLERWARIKAEMVRLYGLCGEAAERLEAEKLETEKARVETQHLRELCRETAEELEEARRNVSALASLIYELDDVVRLTPGRSGSRLKTIRAASDKASRLATDLNVADACDKIRAKGKVLT